MYVLFVGGYAHGKLSQVQDGLTVVEIAAPGKVELYLKYQWLDLLPEHGFDAVFLGKDVDGSELEQLLNDALRQAEKQLE